MQNKECYLGIYEILPRFRVILAKIRIINIIIYIYIGDKKTLFGCEIAQEIIFGYIRDIQEKVILVQNKAVIWVR